MLGNRSEPYLEPFGTPALMLRVQRMVGGLLDLAYLWGLVSLWMKMWSFLRAPIGWAIDWRWEALHSWHWKAVSLRPMDFAGWDRQTALMALSCWAAAHRLLPSGLLAGGAAFHPDGSRASWMIGFLRQMARFLNYSFLALWVTAVFFPGNLGFWMQTRGILIFSFLVFGNGVCFLLRGVMLHDAVVGIARYGDLATPASLSISMGRIPRLFVLPAAILLVGIGPFSLKWSIVRCPPVRHRPIDVPQPDPWIWKDRVRP